MSALERFITFLRWGSRNAVCEKQARSYDQLAHYYVDGLRQSDPFDWGYYSSRSCAYKNAARRCRNLKRYYRNS